MMIPGRNRSHRNRQVEESTDIILMTSSEKYTQRILVFQEIIKTGIQATSPFPSLGGFRQG